MFDLTMENNLNPQQAPMAETDQLPFSLPPYPQMIMEAIEASNDVNGINKTAIAKHIESTQVTLPPSHTTLLNYHLNQMKQLGQISLVKNNYMKPNPDAPPKRGRGRPPKTKSPGESSQVAIPDPPVSPTRPRGRPPKSDAAKSEAVKSKEPPRVSGRGRGRPPKKAKTESETVEAATEAPAPAPAAANGERRGRGRPPKVKPAMVPVGC